MTAETVTARALNRATLERQLLTRREPIGVAEALSRVVALQAQHVASPYLALWNRVDDLDPAAVDAAFAGYEAVRATLLRMTLQVVTGSDYAVFRDAIEPTMYATHIDGRFTPAGLTPAAARTLLDALLEFTSTPRSSDAIKDWLGSRIGAVSPAGMWGIVRSYTPFLRVPTGGPWSFTARSSYVAADPPPTLDLERSDDALRVFVERFLGAYGPSTAADVGKFALVQQARVKRALRAMGGGVRQLDGPGDRPLFDLHGASVPDGSAAVPARLLPMWDNALLAHADRDRLIPPRYRKLVVRSNGDVLATLLVDGYVAGVWRPAEGGIEATAFDPLPGGVWEELGAEAVALTTVLADRESHPYQRYDRWWAKLPQTGETRLLAA